MVPNLVALCVQGLSHPDPTDKMLATLNSLPPALGRRVRRAFAGLPRHRRVYTAQWNPLAEQWVRSSSHWLANVAASDMSAARRARDYEWLEWCAKRLATPAWQKLQRALGRVLASDTDDSDKELPSWTARAKIQWRKLRCLAQEARIDCIRPLSRSERSEFAVSLGILCWHIDMLLKAQSASRNSRHTIKLVRKAAKALSIETGLGLPA